MNHATIPGNVLNEILVEESKGQELRKKQRKIKRFIKFRSWLLRLPLYLAFIRMSLSFYFVYAEVILVKHYRLQPLLGLRAQPTDFYMSFPFVDGVAAIEKLEFSMLLIIVSSCLSFSAFAFLYGIPLARGNFYADRNTHYIGVSVYAIVSLSLVFVVVYLLESVDDWYEENVQSSSWYAELVKSASCSTNSFAENNIANWRNCIVSDEATINVTDAGVNPQFVASWWRGLDSLKYSSRIVILLYCSLLSLESILDLISMGVLAWNKNLKRIQKDAIKTTAILSD